jgi:hypothetical protein
MARRIGDDACLLDVWMVAYVAGSVDRIPGLVADLPAFLDLAERVGDAQKLFLVYGLGARHCMEMGDLEQTDGLLERIGRLAAQVDNPFFRWLDANYRCCRTTVTGTGDEIEDAALAAFQIGQEAGQPDSLVWFAPQLFVARWSQGRLAEVADSIRQFAEAGGIAAWRAASALTLAQGGELEEAQSIIDGLMGGPADAFPPDVAWLLAHSVLAEVVALVGTDEQAAAEYRLLVPYSGRVPCLGNITRPSITLELAMLAVRAGWDEEADRKFSDAHDQHQRLGAGAWLARTQFEWARFLLSVGEPDRANVLLAEAKEGAAHMGAADVTEAIGLLDGEAVSRRQPDAPNA